MDKHESDMWPCSKMTRGLALYHHVAVLVPTRATRHVTCQVDKPRGVLAWPRHVS